MRGLGMDMRGTRCMRGRSRPVRYRQSYATAVALPLHLRRRAATTVAYDASRLISHSCYGTSCGLRHDRGAGIIDMPLPIPAQIKAMRADARKEAIAY